MFFILSIVVSICCIYPGAYICTGLTYLVLTYLYRPDYNPETIPIEHFVIAGQALGAATGIVVTNIIFRNTLTAGIFSVISGLIGIAVISSWFILYKSHAVWQMALALYSTGLIWSLIMVGIGTILLIKQC